MFCHIPLVFRKVSAASREELEHHVPAAQQNLTQEENAAQRDGILQPEAFGGGGSVFLYHQVPGHCRELHGVDAEDIQRAAAHPQREMHTDSPTLLQPLLYFDAGFGFSERDTLTAPDYVCDELTGTVTATFELPTAAQALRFDPGELPCCITNLSFSDDRLLCVPANGLTLPGDSILFLGDDPNFRLEGLTHYPAGMKLVVSYCYFPLETLTDEPLFNAVLEGVQHFQKTWNSEARHIQQLEQANAEQQQAVDALHKNIAELHQANAELTARCQAYEKSLEGVLSSSSWRITSPFRRLLGWFHRSR